MNKELTLQRLLITSLFTVFTSFRRPFIIWPPFTLAASSLTPHMHTHAQPPHTKPKLQPKQPVQRQVIDANWYDQGSGPTACALTHSCHKASWPR